MPSNRTVFTEFWELENSWFVVSGFVITRTWVVWEETALKLSTCEILDKPSVWADKFELVIWWLLCWWLNSLWKLVWCSAAAARNIRKQCYLCLNHVILTGRQMMNFEYLLLLLLCFLTVAKFWNFGHLQGTIRVP